MGYSTDFEGKFELDRPLDAEKINYLKLFAETRRMKRDAKLTEKRVDTARQGSVNLPVGREGCYFVGETGEFGQDRGEDVIDYNKPPRGQPSLWCQWIPSEDGKSIKWDGGEKFYHYVEWIEYIVEHFLKPWGYKLNGTVKWQGAYETDTGTITVTDNHVAANAS